MTGCPDWANYGQHLLPWSLFRNEAFLPTVHNEKASFSEDEKLQMWDRLLTEIADSDCKNIIISSEEIDCLSNEEIDDFCSYFAGFDVSLIMYLRNFCDFFESAHKTEIIHSRSAPGIRELINSGRIRSDIADYLLQWKKNKNCVDCFIIDYDDPTVRRNSVSVFAETLGLPTRAENDAIPKENVSLSSYSCEIIRFMISKGMSYDFISHEIQKFSRIEALIGAPDKFTLLPSDLVEQLTSDYEKILQFLRTQRFFKRIGEFSGHSRAAPRQPINNVVEAMAALTQSLAKL